MKQSAYLIIDAIVFVFALVLSLDKKPKLYKHWKSLLCAIIGTTLIVGFIEVYFANINVLSYEKPWVGNTEIFGLPMEEWLSVISFAFATTVIYQWLKVYTGRYFKSGGNYLFIGLGIFLVVVANFHIDAFYTVLFFISTGLLLLLHVIVFRSKYTGIFMLAFLFIFIAFVVDRIVLARLPVIGIKETYVMQIRFFGIPVEDMVYILFLSLLDITILEFSKKLLEPRSESRRSSKRRSSGGGE